MPMAERLCLECGADILERGKGAVRCAECVISRHREHSNAWKKAHPEYNHNYYVQNRQEKAVVGKVCERCGELFDSNLTKKRFCSERCRRNAAWVRNKNPDKAKERNRIYNATKRDPVRAKEQALQSYQRAKIRNAPAVAARQVVRQRHVLLRRLARAIRREIKAREKEALRSQRLLDRSCSEKTEEQRRAHADKTREWARRNPDKARAKNRRKRHARRAVTRGVEAEKFQGDIYDLVVRAQGGKCAGCKKRFNKRLKPTLDHILPLSKGGGHKRTNLQAMCMPCNSSKGAKDPLVFARERGMLL